MSPKRSLKVNDIVRVKSCSDLKNTYAFKNNKILIVINVLHLQQISVKELKKVIKEDFNHSSSLLYPFYDSINFELIENIKLLMIEKLTHNKNIKTKIPFY